MSIAVLGAGAFGTALAIALGQDRDLLLWARDPQQAQTMAEARENAARLPGAAFPKPLQIASDLTTACAADVILVAVPMQKLRGFLQTNAPLLHGKPLVACCKGMEIGTGLGPLSVIRSEIDGPEPTILTGPSFAADIAKGLPTALTLACRDGALCAKLQRSLSTPSLRLYRSGDTIGAELGGALKNVIAIACGAVIGAGLGESARAALMTRGYAEMQRLALAQGARADTLAGLSGFGDLALTCASPLSRNFRLGLALGRKESFDASITVEGAATAQAIAAASDLDLPITRTVTNLVHGDLTIDQAVDQLLKRPLKEE